MSAYIYYGNEPGEDRELARKLLALTDDPNEVQHTTDDGGGFRVPEHLADRYHQSLLGSATPQPEPPAAKKTTAPRPRRARKES